MLSSLGNLGLATEAAGGEEKEDSAFRTLEREVGIMVAIRHPNVVLFMGLCMDPACMVTEFCSRG